MNRKTKILILEPFYTNFHNDFAKFLSDDIHTFIFNLGNILYTKEAKKIVVHSKILNQNFNKADIEIVKNIKTLYSETLRKIENREPSLGDIEYQAKYISFLREYLQEQNINLVIMHNDLRWQHRLGIEVCKELNIDYLVTERGLFRPYTTTVDFKGVNAYSSIIKDKEYYKNISIKEKQLPIYTVTKFINLKVNIKFIAFILLNKIGDLFGQNTTIRNKNYKLLQYAKLFIKQKLFFKNKSKEFLPNKYIFVPLQVKNDTQILIHSNFKDIQEFITKIENDFYSLDLNIRNGFNLVFKIHPLENGIVDYKFHSKSYISNMDTRKLIKNSEFVVTLNSTVGFEALQYFKTVIVLAEAFYKIEEIVILSSKNNFFSDLEKICKNNDTIDQKLIKKFVKYLRYDYQINGNLFNFDKNMFIDIYNKLKKKER